MMGTSGEGGSPTAHDDNAAFGDANATTFGLYPMTTGDPDGDASVESGEGDDFDHSSNSHSQEDGSSIYR